MVFLSKLFKSLLCLFLPSQTIHAVEIIAHRGASGLAPENTVAAFDLAWKSGADSCELDLYLTADNEIAVIHDATTKRTTGIDKKVNETTLRELKTLDAGSWKGTAFKGETIPSLAEALATMPVGKQRFFLEIKDTEKVVPVLARQLESWKPRASQLCVIAFDRTVAREAKKQIPWIKVFRLSSEKTKSKTPVDLAQLIQDTKDDGLDGLDLGLRWNWSPDLVSKVKAAGLELYVWTVNNRADARRLASLGINGIATDHPEQFREWVKP